MLPSPDRKTNFPNYPSIKPRTICFFTLIIFLQFLLLFTITQKPTITTYKQQQQQQQQQQRCPYGKIYIYKLPSLFNTDIVKNCDKLNPWSSRCTAFSNSGLGKPANISLIIPKNISSNWYWTDQFSLEVIYHNRMLNYKCTTLDENIADAFYIPFYTGLSIEQALFNRSSTVKERDEFCENMLDWVGKQTNFKRNGGWDHFLTVGRVSWDFRRTDDKEWGSSCFNMAKIRNVTRLLIEQNPWDKFDIAVPYPTDFHPRSVDDVRTWQGFVRSKERRTLFCFAGATRGFIKDDFRGVLLNQCFRDSEACKVVDCGGRKCVNGSSEILETFLESDFCLQPRGDSLTRRSIFDCMVAGSIPVFFWRRTAYLQYGWFLPSEPGSYSVFINRYEVKNGTSIRGVLEGISKDKVRAMREKVIENIPRIVYANANHGLEGMSDAFDVAIEGVLRRIKEHKGR